MSDNSEVNNAERFYYAKSSSDSKEAQIGVDQSGEWVYSSGARSGYVPVEVPLLPGDLTPTKTMLVRDLPGHMLQALEGSLNQSYLKTGPQANPVEVLNHYIGAIKGLELMDGPGLKRLDELATEFEETPYRREYVQQVLKPYLQSMGTRQRGK